MQIHPQSWKNSPSPRVGFLSPNIPRAHPSLTLQHDSRTNKEKKHFQDVIYVSCSRHLWHWDEAFHSVEVPISLHSWQGDLSSKKAGVQSQAQRVPLQRWFHHWEGLTIHKWSCRDLRESGSWRRKFYEAAVLLWAFKRNTRKYAHTAVLYFLIHQVVLEEALFTFQKIDHELTKEQQSAHF